LSAAAEMSLFHAEAINSERSSTTATSSFSKLVSDNAPEISYSWGPINRLVLLETFWLMLIVKLSTRSQNQTKI
jgi:hypothetical protein